MPYGLRLIECLLKAEVEVWLLYSQVAQIVARQEMKLALPSRPDEVATLRSASFGTPPERLRAFGREERFAPLASGSNPPEAMVVCPCTMGTLASIAAGLSSNLIERAADVVIRGAQADPGAAYADGALGRGECRGVRGYSASRVTMPATTQES